MGSFLMLASVALGGQLDLRGAGSGVRFVNTLTGSECTLLIEGGVLKATCPIEESVASG